VKTLHRTSLPKYLPVLFSRLSNWENRLASLGILKPLNPKISSRRYSSVRDSKLMTLRCLNRHRRAREEYIEEPLNVLQRWQSERLGAVEMGKPDSMHIEFVHPPRSFTSSSSITKGPFKFTQVSRALHRISALSHRTNLTQSDLTAVIERYRTGLFRPDPRVYKLVVVFGVDLRKWSEGSGTPSPTEKGRTSYHHSIPPSWQDPTSGGAKDLTRKGWSIMPVGRTWKPFRRL
jgi:hypothetical protein